MSITSHLAITLATVTENENEQPRETRVALNLPPEHEAGVYASFAQIWRTPDGFVLDFAVSTMPPVEQVDESTSTTFQLAPAKVVSRVRIPPGQAWEFMRALNEQLDLWEQEYGRRPNQS